MYYFDASCCSFAENRAVIEDVDVDKRDLRSVESRVREIDSSLDNQRCFGRAQNPEVANLWL